MKPQGKTPAFAAYLQCRDKAGRMQHLTELKQAPTPDDALPISLAEDLLTLELGADEKLALLEATASRDGLAFEHFLTRNLFSWPQDLAALAVRLWSHRTDNLLWFRLLDAVRSPLLPQRVLYAIVDNAHFAGGRRLVTTACDVEALENMSTAFHGLLLHRAVQWNVGHDRLTKLATHTLSGLGTNLHPDNKAVVSALAYFARFAPEELTYRLRSSAIAEPWRDILRAIIVQCDLREVQTEQLSKLLRKRPKGKTQAHERYLIAFSTLWPSVWQRSDLDASIVASALRLTLDNESQDRPAYPGTEKTAATGIYDPLFTATSHPWETFAGITEGTLHDALNLLDDDKTYARAISFLGGLLAAPANDDLLTTLKARVAAAEDPAAMLANLPLRLRLEMTDGSAQQSERSTPFTVLKAEESAILAHSQATQVASFFDYGNDGQNPTLGSLRQALEDSHEVAARKAFFSAAYRNQTDTNMVQERPHAQDGIWQLLLDAWTEPKESKLAPLAQAARQVDGVFRLCYINTLGRFQGMDQAALKILDFIRSKEEDDLRAVINALGGIGTPRALQELVAAVTRPNITPALRLEICTILQKQDVSNLQAELRSAIKDLGPPKVETAETLMAADVREALAGLLSPSQVVERNQSQTPSPETSASDSHLDQTLSGKIRHYKDLSSEVKRALRTSQFFHFQVSGDRAPESIDLSPVIDMQYKALELLFRETFEEPCSRLIHRGVLQRRLDVIGYARPIPRAMDEFEAYIAALPVIRDIPFFSKFKLRKMLRAICQFRPGKRFTLDGLKAFALFFLCFSRQECRYGLGGLFPLGFQSDTELYQFCRELHVLQDFRNRAAHEGFHPDASNDIDGIWRTTAEIVQTMYKAKTFIDSNDTLAHVDYQEGEAANTRRSRQYFQHEHQHESEHAPKNRSNPIIERKITDRGAVQKTTADKKVS